jgi:hypothetical protein
MEVALRVVPRPLFVEISGYFLHSSLLLKEGVPVKVVSERLGHAHIAHTLQIYQHILPACKPTRRAPPNASPTRVPRPRTARGNVGATPEGTPPDPGEHSLNDEGPGR